MNKYLIVFLAICLVSIFASPVTPENEDCFKDVKEELREIKIDVLKKIDDMFNALDIKEKIGSSFDKIVESLDQISSEVNSAAESNMEK